MKLIRLINDDKILNKIIYITVLSSVLLTSSKSQNEIFVQSSSDQITSILNSTCYTNDKIEFITGKKRSLISPKVVKAWKQGNLNFTYNHSCDLARLRSSLKHRAYSNEIISNKKSLYKKIQITLREKLSEDGDGKGTSKSWEMFNKENDPVLSRESTAANVFSEIAERMHYASRCEHHFIAKAKQEFGSLGKTVKTTLSSQAVKDLLNHNITFGGACPGYIDMNSEQRKNLWVFVMMSMSHYESSCKETALNQGPYGLAAGLLQLHQENEDLYSKWDPDLNCERGVSKSAKKSLKCALTMIGNQIYKGVAFFDDNSHWQVLRKSTIPGSQAYHIKYAISQIPDCKSNPFYFDLGSLNYNSKQREVYKTSRTNFMKIALNNPNKFVEKSN